MAAIEKSSKDFPSGEFDDDKIFDDGDVKVISQQECLSKLQGLKDEINQSWCADDRVTSLRLSIKVSFPSKIVTSLGFFVLMLEIFYLRVLQYQTIGLRTLEGDTVCL